jgi:hypothetical protein
MVILCSVGNVCAFRTAKVRSFSSRSSLVWILGVLSLTFPVECALCEVD